MTQAQMTELEAAIERACRYGIEVVAQGHRKSDHARILCTTSHTDPERWHIVSIERNRRLSCDCKSHVICSHRAAVYMHLVVEASRRAHLADVVEAALAGEKAYTPEQNPNADKAHESRVAANCTALAGKADRLVASADRLIGTREAPRLADDSRTVSIFR